MSRAGPRRSRVAFYRPTVTSQNSSGGDVTSNVLLGSAWVRIDALKGREMERGQQLQAEAYFKIETEHPLTSYTLQRADIMTWGSRTLDIESCEDPTQRRRGQVIFAKELTD